MTILMIGDVVGEVGLRALEAGLPQLIARYNADFVIVNGENAVEGYGITVSALARISASGADIVTSGNHIWEKNDIWEFLERRTAYGMQIMKGEALPLAPAPQHPRHLSKVVHDLIHAPAILRPANYPAPAPGSGAGLLEKNGKRLLVVNVQGREYMTALDCPFQTAAAVIAANPTVPAVIDFHAESSAEKEALGFHLDGRVSVIAGTHTHIQTADAKILPGGTAYITDLGMTGPTDGVIGMDTEICLARAKTQVLYRMQCAEGPCAIQGIAVDIAENGLARSISTIWLNVDDENAHKNENEEIENP
jgi:metallophosphoesterase (TIGR00282 family)